MPKCSATRKHDGQPCQQPACTRNGQSVCRYHGGKTPKGRVGPKHPAFKHGKYSQALPRNLRPVFEAIKDSPELLSLFEEIALCDSRIVSLLRQARNPGLSMIDQKRIWSQVNQLVELRRKLTSDQFRHSAFLESYCSSDQVMTLLAAIAESIRSRLEAYPDLLQVVIHDWEQILASHTRLIDDAARERKSRTTVRGVYGTS